MVIISVGNTGLLLAQNCVDHPGIAYTGVRITEGPLYLYFQQAAGHVQKFSNYPFSVNALNSFLYMLIFYYVICYRYMCILCTGNMYYEI